MANSDDLLTRFLDSTRLQTPPKYPAAKEPVIQELVGLPNDIRGLILSQGRLSKTKIDRVISAIIALSTGFDWEDVLGVAVSNLEEKYVCLVTFRSDSFRQFAFTFDRLGAWTPVEVPRRGLMTNDDGGDKAGKRLSLRPRWAEELRPKKQVKLRLEPNLIEQVDTAASEKGLTRNDWIEQAIKRSIDPKVS